MVRPFLKSKYVYKRALVNVFSIKNHSGPNSKQTFCQLKKWVTVFAVVSIKGKQHIKQGHSETIECFDICAEDEEIA